MGYRARRVRTRGPPRPALACSCPARSPSVAVRPTAVCTQVCTTDMAVLLRPHSSRKPAARSTRSARRRSGRRHRHRARWTRPPQATGRRRRRPAHAHPAASNPTASVWPVGSPRPEVTRKVLGPLSLERGALIVVHALVGAVCGDVALLAATVARVVRALVQVMLRRRLALCAHVILWGSATQRRTASTRPVRAARAGVA